MQPIFIQRTQSERAYLLIGQIAALTGASRRAIRLYESRGLIPPPRRKGRYRIYSEHEAMLVHMIKTAQSVGFSLNEVREMVAHKAQHKTFPLQLANALFAKKRLALREQIAAIRALDRRLVSLQKLMNRTFG